MSRPWRPRNANELGSTKTRSASGGLLALAVILAMGVAGVSVGQNCTYTFSPPALSVPVEGGNSFEIQVATQPTCAWQAGTTARWISIRGNGTGTGSGSFRFGAEANRGAARAGTVEVGGRSLQVSQLGATTCTFRLSSTNATAPPTGGSVSPAVAVTTQPGCEWRVVSLVDWLPATAGSTFQGNGSVVLTAAANSTPATRTGSVTVAGEAVTVQQASVCGTRVSPTTLTAASTPPGPYTTQVSFAATCQWEAVANDRWLVVSPVGTQTGPGIVTVTVEPNHGATRQGTLTVAGVTVTVNQTAGVACVVTAPPTVNLPAVQSHQSFMVQAQTGCSWRATANDSWIAITSGQQGEGSAPVGFDVTANPTTTPRNGSITVADKTVAIVQTGAPPCSALLTPMTLTLQAQAATPTLSVSTAATCEWTVVSSVTWITIVGTPSGTGPRTLQLQVGANTQPIARSGNVTTNGNRATVNQAAAPPCAVVVSPPTGSLPGTGGEATFAVTSQCSWTVQPSATWLTIRSGANGTGNGQVVVSAGMGSIGAPRTATLTIGDKSVTVTQAAFTGRTGGSTAPQASPSPGTQPGKTPAASVQPRKTPTPRPKPRT